ncbi:DASH family cryptochrome [Pseudomonas sp. NW5]|uniref:DASH family cryptochrome n=1 Tax=Pseudomonas sp. NW5 TaxID=2934934 RepID=UPI002020778C|nr:DASH family cryptochrome [Pseudomonas sp. NW5]MCL7463069.1 DASH family cryptochrome [Pseudomonas sp. NW5]
MSTLIYWFRNDLRLSDNPALSRACRDAEHLLPVYVHAADEPTAWGFSRVGAARRHFTAQALEDLDAQLRERGSRLLELVGDPVEVLGALAAELGCTRLISEEIPAPEEQAAVEALRAAGLTVETHWQSSLLHPGDLPFACAQLPENFSAFRNRIERAEVLPAAPLPAPASLPPLPEAVHDISSQRPAVEAWAADARSSFPFTQPAFHGGERAALAHVQRYFASDLPVHYKATRNGLSGTDYSSKFSPWLASGALSPRSIYDALCDHEQARGASDGSYWLWFELLWRDYFRFLHVQHGRRLYRSTGLARQAVRPPRHTAAAFARWCEGKTGEPLVDAGMRELAATGYLSNRLRQIVASYLIHDLQGDWRAGAAWFEAQLIDYDVCSNQGNWLYIAGRGTDPRGGRRFNPQKQAADYDGDGAFRRLWQAR